MKKLVLIMVSIAAASLFTSCGECACNSYNPALLRDVPVTTSRSFE